MVVWEQGYPDSTNSPLSFTLLFKIRASSTKQPNITEMEKVFTLSRVAQHNLKQDCWLVINGNVLDVTNFLEEHPGGEEALVEYSGTDATKAFEDIGHSKEAKNLLLKYRVGQLPGLDFPVSEFTSDEPPFQKEMKAFVMKEDSKTKKTALLELFVPFLVVVFYLSYRYFEI